MVIIHACPPRSASTWLEAVFLGLGEVIHFNVHPRGTINYKKAIEEGGLKDRTIYPAVMSPWEKLSLSACTFSYRVLHVQRDPRDLFVSLYYSILHSHVLEGPICVIRPLLRQASFEEGLELLFDSRNLKGDLIVEQMQLIMLSYRHLTRADHCMLVEYVDITQKPFDCFRAFLDFCEIELPDQTLKDVLEARTFSHLAGGRKPGEEDTHHHFRKGVSGDWREKFTPAIKNIFKERFNQHLIDLGYEKDDTW